MNDDALSTLTAMGIFLLFMTGNWLLGAVVCATMILFEVYRAD